MNKPVVMVALRDPEHVDSLVKLACKLANDVGGELIALHVAEVGPGLPLDADVDLLDRPGRAILSQAQRIASEQFSRRIFTRLARARDAGEAIVTEVRENNVDLLVLGYRQSRRVGEILLGSTVRRVAKRAPCKMIIEIPPREEYVMAAKERGEWGELMRGIS